MGAVTHQAAIQVGPTGTGVQTFDTQPVAADWSTLAVAGAAGDFTTASAIDTAVQSHAATDITTAIGSSSTVPPSANGIARRNTTNRYLQSRSSAGGYTVFMATLQNNSGAPALFLNVSYNFGITMAAGSTAAEQVPGLRAYWSLTGAAGSWQLIPALSTDAPGVLSTRLSLGSWAAGAPLYLLWADDDSAAGTTAPSEEGAYWIDDFQAVASSVREPVLSGFTSSGIGFAAQIENGGAPRTLNVNSIVATLNGTNVATQVTQSGDVFTVSYSGAPLAVGSTNVVNLTFSDNGTPANTQTVQRTFVVQPYQVIPAAYAVTGVNTSLPGFKAYVHQIGGARNPGDVNSIQNAERQLAGVIIDPLTGTPYANEADLSLAVNGAFNVPGVINWNQDAPAATGSFSDATTPARVDEPIPGIPGMNGSIDNIAAEIMTFLELKAGAYTMGVNSDDGFKVTVGPNPRDAMSLVLGSFGTGRGVADSLFNFVVQQDGIYPFRLLWWEGTGGAAVEWFMVSPSGEKILINDREIPGAVKAYREGPAGPIFVRLITPFPGVTNVNGNATVEVILADSATAVNPSTVQAYFNNQLVNATVSKPAGSTDTTISFDPAGVLAPESSHTVRIVYGSSAAALTTNEFSFKIKPAALIAIDETTMWRYHNEGADLGTAWREKDYNDSAWPQGAALLSNESTAAEPIRTQLVRQSPEGNQIITDYFRHRFTFNGNPAAVQLILSHIIDDGAIFYLNGTEVHRFGTAATTVVTNSTLFSDHETGLSGPYIIPAGSLVVGENVLAVEVHQTSATSSDVSMGAELLASIRTDIPPTSIESFTPALNAANLSSNAMIRVVVNDGTRQVVPGSIELIVNGQKVNPTVTKAPGSIATVISYTPTTPYAPDSTVTAKVTFADTAGNVTTRDLSFSIEPTYTVILGVNETQMWRYENTGANLGTTWKDKNFNDSAWPEGAAVLAVETEGQTSGETIRTTLSRVGADGNNVITDYFRTKFNFSGDAATARLRLRHLVDDGAVFYLNGVEIHRFGIGEGVAFTSSTFFTGHENRWEGPYPIPQGILVQGENVLAAEVHQSDLTSSDIVFGAELQLITSAPPAVQARFTSVTQSGGNIVVQWTGTGTLESSTTLTGGWQPVANAQNPHGEPLGGRMKFFRVRQ
ncbi:MAG TPA: hypothetical protein VEH27_19850 [Methylomirabilota bacterium]|nr:hypothetical protein [Methylomirabilota bacterium]